MKARWTVVAGLILLSVAASFAAAWASDAQLYFSTDKSGENRVTKVREGDEIWIVVVDPDEDIDCDVRDKFWTDIKVMDTKTGAHIVWESYIDEDGVDTDGDGNGDLVFRGDPEYVPHRGHWPGTTAGWLGADYMEETNHSTGVFVSQRPFQIGTRVDYGDDGRLHAHIVGPYDTQADGAVDPTDFEWGGYLYADGDGDEHGDDRIWVDQSGAFILAQDPDEIPTVDTTDGDGDAWLPPGTKTLGGGEDYMLGRFENMDTLVGLYVDPNDPSDVALGLGKITDEKSSVEWGREIYHDANEAALVTVVDPDENLNCDAVESVPVFILVNPGSWNPSVDTSPTTFCALKRYGGVIDLAGTMPVVARPIVWYNIYDSGVSIDLAFDGSDQPNVDGTYYVDYPTRTEFETPGDPNEGVTWFDTASESGVTRVMFYAQETGPDTGVFQFWINDILRDLGFESLNVRDVLVAYYVDPNDQDDFSLATAYIGEKNHSRLRFTDSGRNDESVFWIGRDPVYIEVTDANANTDPCCPEKVVVHVCDPHEVDDAEWLVLDELSSNSPVFFTNLGMRLDSVWDALGIGDPGLIGGYSLRLDNWELEAFNEDSVYARYNDVLYVEGDLAQIGDIDTGTAFPPEIQETRVANDVSFSLFHVGDTQVYDGEEMTMYFLDRQGDRVDGYLNSDCVFIEVVDPDQDEDQQRRERIDGYWDGHQNVPFGPQHRPWNRLECGYRDDDVHIVNELLGDTNIFAPFVVGAADGDPADPDNSWAKLYVLNPRSGRWAVVDLLETGIDTGDFVSVTCIDLVDQHECVPSLGVLPGDTLLAVYHDPSNHSDVAWISIKVEIGGALPTGSTLSFVDAEGSAVAAYVEGDPIYVQVVDPSVADAGTLADAVTIDGVTYDLTPFPGAAPGTFIAGPLELGVAAGETVTATYVDPSNPDDTSTATVSIVATEFHVERFYAAPSPFADEARFGFVGSGMAETFAVTVYDLVGRPVWHAEEENVLSVAWDGRNEGGEQLANGAYIYVVVATGSESAFTDKGKVFILR